MSDATLKKTWHTYLITGLAFIPFVGLFFGSLALILLLNNERKAVKRLAWIALCGVVCNRVLFLAPQYLVDRNRDAHFKKKQAGYESYKLKWLSESLEEYRYDYGSYPDSYDSLHELHARGMLSFEEPIPSSYYYELAEGGVRYVLLHVGQDNRPFTEDDILPHAN